MWYEKNYRRHLCDMHIADWNDEFLSQFSPEEYVANLKTAKITNAMIYLQSHAGLCYFPTELGVMHKAFVGKEDMIKRVVDLCHSEGIAVTGYYSLVFNTWEHDRHNDWKMITSNGASVRDGGEVRENEKTNFSAEIPARYGLCCPNSMSYREFVYGQIDEMLEYFTLDGFFFDMPFWSHTCYCDNCRRRFKDELGYEIPLLAETDKEKKDIIAKKYQWMGEFIQSVTDYVRKVAPQLSIEHNFANSIAGDSNNGCGEEVLRACDYAGGDLYGGILNHSLACKFYKNITPNHPFEYMFSRCKPTLASHTLTKTVDEMKSEIMLTAAHHGATLVIDAIDPIGTLDKRVYDRIGNVFDTQVKYEKYFTGEMVEDIGLYFSIKSRFNTYGEVYQNKESCIHASKALIGAHIPFGVTGNYHRLSGYKAVILPMLTDFERGDLGRIKQYVEDGGKLYISGAEFPEMLDSLMGIKFKERTAAKRVYIAPTESGSRYFLDFNEKYPLMFDGSAPICEADGSCEVLATLTLPYTLPNEKRFASIHSNPPGIATRTPLVLRKKVGKGEIVWSAIPLESVGIYEFDKIFLNLLMSLLPEYQPSFKSDCSDEIEITLFDDDSYKTVNLSVLVERPVSKVYPPFKLSVKAESAPKAVKLLPNGDEIPYVYENGYVSFETRALDIFDMYMIEK